MALKPFQSAQSTSCLQIAGIQPVHRSITLPRKVKQQQQQQFQLHFSQASDLSLNHDRNRESNIQTASHSRRQLLLSSIVVAASCTAPSDAAVTVTLKAKTQLKPYVLKAGYSITVPDSWSLAYDRSTDEKVGTQAFFGNFRTFETLSVLRTPKPDGELSPAQLLDWVLEEQRNNQSTYDFQLLSGATPTQRTAPSTDTEQGATDTYYDSEFSLAICRGLIQEGAGGSKRCIGPRDMDLEVVSRTFYQSMTVRDDGIYIIRGSSTTPQWQSVRPVAMEAVQSFRFPAALG